MRRHVGHRAEPGVVFPPGPLIGMVLGLIAAVLVGGLLYERLDRFLWAEYEVHWKPPAWFFAVWCGIEGRLRRTAAFLRGTPRLVPRGVFRFSSFEEADAWMTTMMLSTRASRNPATSSASVER